MLASNAAPAGHAARPLKSTHAIGEHIFYQANFAICANARPAFDSLELCIEVACHTVILAAAIATDGQDDCFALARVDERVHAGTIVVGAVAFLEQRRLIELGVQLNPPVQGIDEFSPPCWLLQGTPARLRAFTVTMTGSRPSSRYRCTALRIRTPVWRAEALRYVA